MMTICSAGCTIGGSGNILTSNATACSTKLRQAGYSGSAGFSGSGSSISSMCSTRVANTSNSYCWGSTGIPGATIGMTILRFSCSGDGFSISGLLLDSLLAATGDSLDIVRLGDTLVYAIRKGDTWGSIVKGPGRFQV